MVDEDKKCDDKCKDCDCEEEKEITTEVTSIAKEEARTGKKIELPNAEELVTRASQSLFVCRKKMEQLMIKMPKRQVVRAMNGVFDLPTGGLPVNLTKDEEKLLYAIGQRAMSDRFIIIQHHINEEMQKEKEKLEKAKKKAKTKKKTTKGVKNG